MDAGLVDDSQAEVVLEMQARAADAEIMEFVLGVLPACKGIRLECDGEAGFEIV